MAYRYYNVRIVGLPAATCNSILRSTTLHVVRRLDEFTYRIRTSRLYENEVRELIEYCANDKGYLTTMVEVDAKRPGAADRIIAYHEYVMV